MRRNIDVLNSFIVEFKRELSTFDRTQFKNAYSLVTESSNNFLMSMINPQMYCGYIDSTIENLNTTTSDVETLDKFFSEIYKSVSLVDKGISIPLHPDEDISRIRPEYLTSIATDFDVVVKKILEGSIKESEIKKKYISSEYFDKIKKQLVKTTLETKDIRDLMTMDSPTIVRIDNMFLQNNTIPFIRAYNQNVKDLNGVAINTKGRIYDTYNSIMSTMNAINTMQANGKIDAKTLKVLDYYRFNVLRNFMSLCAYISGMVIRKISFYSYNMMSYMNLFNTIYDYFPGGELQLHESVIDGTLEDIDDSTLIDSIIHNDLNIIKPYIQSIIGKKKMELANVICNKYGIKINYLASDFDDVHKEYDYYPYVALNKTIIEIANKVQTFAELKKNKEMIVDDIVSQSDLDDTFVNKYGDVLSKVTSVNYYLSQIDTESDKDISLSLLNDISHFDDNIEKISNNIHRVYKFIEDLVDSFDINEDNLDENTFNELKAFSDTIMMNYKDYILMVTKKLLERLTNLSDVLNDNSISDNSIPEQFTPYDYASDIYKEEYQDIVDEEEALFESMIKEYRVNKARKDRGVKVVYEEVTQTDAQNNTATVESDKKVDTQNTSTTTSTTSTSSTTNNQEEKKENIIERFIKWVKEKFTAFKNKAAKMASTNITWLSNAKEGLLSMDTTNTKITTASYSELTIEKLITDINSAKSKISTINANSLPNELKQNETTASLYLFPSIPSKIGSIKEFKSRIIQFYTYGNTQKTPLVSHTGDDAKKKIEEMISFCESYNSKYEEINKALNDLANTAKDKQEDVINSTSGTNTADKSQQKEDEKKVSATSVITNTVRSYSGGILTVLEKKYLDYIKVLGKLAPNKNDNNQNTENNAENTESK